MFEGSRLIFLNIIKLSPTAKETPPKILVLQEAGAIHLSSACAVIHTFRAPAKRNKPLCPIFLRLYGSQKSLIFFPHLFSSYLKYTHKKKTQNCISSLKKFWVLLNVSGFVKRTSNTQVSTREPSSLYPPF